jgi:NAD(P)-dependent dehydrogenase (short-subunit alcohol dehydrogenase family)
MDTSDTEVVVVTGASAGVGRATAREFGEHGAKVALLARGEDGLEGAKKEVEAAGGVALPIPTDVADPEQVEAAAQRVEDELGPIDVWVNDAIAVIFSPFKDIEPEDFKRSTEVCYLGAVYGTKAALKRMLPRDRGTIVQVGSALSYRAIPLQSAYCGAKHAMRGFTDSVRTELLHDGSNVHITMVQLPAINTPQFNISKTTLPKHPQPVPPIYQPEVPARAIYWAAHQRRREVWVGLSSVIVISGNKLLPGLGDRYLARTGYDSQQTNQPVDENRPNNLYEPVPGDHGAHGDFDEESNEESPQLWATEHLGLLALAAGAGLLAVAAAMLKR